MIDIDSFPARAPLPSAMRVEAPAATGDWRYETLAYVDAYDAVLGADYAFVAYRETNVASGAWCVRVRSSQTAGGVFEPDAIRARARAAGARGEPWFPWGYGFEPSPGDPRQIEFRVHVRDGRPDGVELFVRLRNADGSAAEPRAVAFAWPEREGVA